MRIPSTPPANEPKWLLLIHQIPAKPDYLRVKVGRQLRHLGAVAIKSSVYVVPAQAAMRSAMAAIVKDVLRDGGEAVVCEAQWVLGLADGTVEELFRAARDAEYLSVAGDARRLATELRGKRAANEARRRQAARQLERLRLRFDDIVLRDTFGAAGREAAAGTLSLAEDRIHGVELGAGASDGMPEPPRGGTWVTRAGIMVDRIASAWLIRRFIDPAARFKFVSGRGYKPAPRELRFDMAAAEFTHHDGRCTFEVLVDRFQLRDSSLQPIAEIVYDIDLEDGRFQRPETPGMSRVIVGLAIGRKTDEERLAQGAALFDSLYESFRQRSR